MLSSTDRENVKVQKTTLNKKSVLPQTQVNTSNLRQVSVCGGKSFPVYWIGEKSEIGL